MCQFSFNFVRADVLLTVSYQQSKNKHACNLSFPIKITSYKSTMGYLPLQSPALCLHDGGGVSLQPFQDILSAKTIEIFEEKTTL